jgi:hypothetical protein
MGDLGVHVWVSECQANIRTPLSDRRDCLAFQSHPNHAAAITRLAAHIAFQCSVYRSSGGVMEPPSWYRPKSLSRDHSRKNIARDKFYESATLACRKLQ